MNNESSRIRRGVATAIAFLLILAAVAALVIGIPAVILSALSTVFGFPFEYGFREWLAVVTLLAALWLVSS